MRKRVVITLMEGSFEQGFPALLQISEYNALTRTDIQIPGQLPANPNIPKQFRNWQLAYRQIVMPHSRIRAKPAQVTNISCSQLGNQLVNSLNDWLNSGSRDWQKIRQGLQINLNQTDEVEILIQTNNLLLRQLPWHQWDFFKFYTKAEIALSNPEFKRPIKSLIKPVKRIINILAILGNSENINVNQDRTFFEQLSRQADTKFLVEPSFQEFNENLWNKNWDILFFAGHSYSEEKGQILLNKTEIISLTQLRYALTKAIEKGLGLAIFNSCDGLGLAQELFDLNIPQVIVMREPVPDAVAQAFLKHFLTAFVKGKSLYTSVREARERLEAFENQYPYATWLPVICQNSAVVSPSWQELCGVRTSLKKRIQMVLVMSVAVTALVIGVRHLGMLQTWELQAYDQLMRSRPEEALDRRLLIVTVTEEDFQLPQQNPRTGSISDLALSQLLEKLAQFKPRAIGLDIYRDFPLNSTQTDLAARMQSDNNFFAICKVSDREANHPGIAPPVNVPPERLGFSDVVADPDGVLRRHLIAMEPESSSPCTTPYALSAQLAFHYLQAEGISARYTPKGDLQIGNVVFQRLQGHAGGYQTVDTWGYQILLNYRSYRLPRAFAPIVTLTDVLNGKLKPDDVRDRIVLIGVTAESANDYGLTPFSAGKGFYQAMAGVVIQAHMVSQLLSAVKDERPLLSVWPVWGEMLWVWCWSVVGAFLVWCGQFPYRDTMRSQLYKLLLQGAAQGLLLIICYSLFVHGKWVPLIPSALALLLTSGSIAFYQKSP